MYVSADMQKVTMLPYMMGVKSYAFTNRPVAFHETFAPLGKQKDKHQIQVRSILRHEAIAGRSAADVTSVFIKVITDMSEDAKNITIWSDNCSGQNKNWVLFKSLVRIMNDEKVMPHLNSVTVTIKYLETGHTFMSCDSFHGLVEKSMRIKEMIYNFSDFVSAIQTAGGAPKTIEMQVADFSNWDRHVTSGKTASVPKIRDFDVQFRKGSTFLFFFYSHNDEVFRKVEFLMKKTLREISEGLNKLKANSLPRGIQTWKKDGIVNVLCKLMPDQKQLFWHNMASNDEAIDLTKNAEISEVEQE